MPKATQWTPWSKVVTLREDVRTGELSLAEFAADLHDVVTQQGKRPVYEKPERFFAFTYPTIPLRDLVRDVALRLAGKNTKAIRQLELTYGGGKTHTLVTLRHLTHDPDSLPELPAVKQFRADVGEPLPEARVAALCFDKLDVEKGMEVLGPEGSRRWLKHPWSVLAFQIAGADGLKLLHPDDADDERETPPAEPLLTELLSKPQDKGLATLVLIDEVLMYVRGKAALADSWRTRLIDFFQCLCQAVDKVDHCALVASLLASDPKSNDAIGKELTRQVFDIFNRQKEAGIQPVQKDDVTEVLRRRFFEPSSIAEPDTFRPHVTKAVANIARLADETRKQKASAEKRFLNSYPFHPDLTDVLYSKWTQLDGFQRTRGILRTFAVALRDAEKWDPSPLIGPNIFLAEPGNSSLAEAARELAGTATRELTDGTGNDWTTVLEGELEKARAIQEEQLSLKFREAEQAVIAAFLNSQPIGQKTHTPELLALLGATGPDRIELEKALRRWTELSWFLDEAEFPDGSVGRSGQLPQSWRLGNQPNLKQMHDDACKNRVTAERVEQTLIEFVRKTKSLIQGASADGARTHMLPQQPRDIADDGDFRFAVLGPTAVSESGKPSAEARRFVEQTTGPDRPRVNRNAVVLITPSRDGLGAVRTRVREYLGWTEVRSQLGDLVSEPDRKAKLSGAVEQARGRLPDSVRQAWSIAVAVNERNEIQAFKAVVGSEPLFATIKADRRARIQETAISPEALLPGGPYDLWRTDEDSRFVKDLVAAFAQNPKLPKMLRHKAILDTVDEGVRKGIFVASLVRPDKSVKTWWRTPIDETARADRSLELFLPAKTELTELHPNLLVPGGLPELWDGEVIRVAEVREYFSGDKTVTLQHDGYAESVSIPACVPGAIAAGIAEAVRQGKLWLVNGPASFQGETLAAGILSDAAELRAPLSPLPPNELGEEELPEAWSNGRTNVIALLTALAVKKGNPYPWSIICQSVDGALRARWLAIAPDSGPWPCELSAAAAATLMKPAGRLPPEHRPGGALTCAADLEPNELQDLAQALPEIVKQTAGIPLSFHLKMTLGVAAEVPNEVRLSVNKVLNEIRPDLQLKE